MAGEWLKFDASTPEKPEVLAITVSMGWDDPDLTVGKLLRVWRWFDQQTVDGNAPGVTAASLDRLIGVSGFVEAMRKVGWIVVDDDGIHLPNFDRHNGKTAKDRALTAKRVAVHKSKAKANGDGCIEGNGEIVSDALPREEKRRINKEPPYTPQGGKRRQSKSMTFRTWVAAVKEANDKPIPPADPIFDYCEQVGLPQEFLTLHWREFKQQYATSDKRYADWRRVLRVSVRRNWFRLWTIRGDGDPVLTTAGEQARREFESEPHREAA